MNSRKLEFSEDVIRRVRELCAVAFNISNEQQLENVFGISTEQMESVIHEIIEALPERVFDKKYPRLIDEVKNIFAREFIFFQVQEKWNDEHYKEDLSKFIHIFSRDIQQRISKQEMQYQK